MKWLSVKVYFDCDNRLIAEELIANAFTELGVQGVAIETTDETPQEGWAPDIDLSAHKNAVTGYFPDNETGRNNSQKLEEQLARLTQTLEIRLHTEYERIDEQVWAESWKAYFWPEKLSQTIVVKPTWRTYDPEPGDKIIELDPGMAFGTGTHATTRLCIQLLEKYLENDDTVLDIGTGSGILLVAASKLGARMVYGVDIDPVAVGIARDNLSRNQVPASCYQVMEGDLTAGIEHRYSIVVANILSEVIITLLDQIPRVLLPGGLFICSGIVEENHESVLKKMHSVGFEILESQFSESWAAISGRLSGPSNS